MSPNESSKKSAWTEFKDFVMKGNVVDLAIAIVIGTYFGVVIKDVVGLILSFLAIPGTKTTDFAKLTAKIGHGSFAYGALIVDLFTFLVVAAAVFFLVVRPMRGLVERRRAEPEPESDDRPCPECLSSIPKAAVRCAYCTAAVNPLAAA